MALPMALILARPSPVSADPIAPNASLTLSGGNLVRFSTPILADVNGDGAKEMVVGTSDGKVYAIATAPSGARMNIVWMHDTANDLGGATAIRASLAVSDLDRDGRVEVVAAVGQVFAFYRQGGVVVLDGPTGATKLVRKSYDLTGQSFAPDGYTDGVVGTPALADLDNDGKQEIIWGSFDHRVYAMRFNGEMMPGWPVFVRDTVWTTPAMADLDGDGFLEVVFGIDTHAEGSPYNTQDGGALIAFRGNGQRMWTQTIAQTIFSSPLITDLENDGQLEIIHGGGDNFASAAAQDAGRRVYVRDASGNIKWTGVTGGCVCQPIAVGDVNGDGRLEVIASSYDNRVYVWRSDGSLLWSAAPLNFQGKNERPGPPAIADYNGDGVADVFVNTGWEAAALNGMNGAQLTATRFPGDARPAYNTEWAAFENSPLVADVDRDGKQEIVVASGASNGNTGKVFLFDLNTNASGALPAAFGQAGRTALPIRPHEALVMSHSLPAVMNSGESATAQVTLMNIGTSAWTQNAAIELRAVTGADAFASPTRLMLNAGETVAPGQTRAFSIVLRAPSTPGYYTTTWRMAVGGAVFGRAAQSVVKVGNQPAFQTLTTHGMFGGGLASAGLPAPSDMPDWPRASAFYLTADKRGYFLYDIYGGYHWGGAALPITTNAFPSPVKEMAFGPDAMAQYVLLGNGQIYKCIPLPPCQPAFTGIPQGINAKSFALVPGADPRDVSGVYVLDGNGNVYRDGSAPALALPGGMTGNGDIFRRVRRATNGAVYAMDMFGRVWALGGAPALLPNYAPRIGQDWARDFAITENSAGYYLQDKFNGIYAGGGAANVWQNPPPAFADDTARGLGMMDSRAPAGALVLPLRFYFPLVVAGR